MPRPTLGYRRTPFRHFVSLVEVEPVDEPVSKRRDRHAGHRDEHHSRRGLKRGHHVFHSVEKKWKPLGYRGIITYLTITNYLPNLETFPEKRISLSLWRSAV